MKSTIAYAMVALLWLAGVASADVFPEKWSVDPDQVKLCDAETTISVPCQRDPGAGLDEIVWITKAYSTVVVDLSESVGAFTCFVYGNNVGNDESGDVGQALHTTALSASALSVTLDAPPTHIWVECSSIATSVTAVGYGRRK